MNNTETKIDRNDDLDEILKQLWIISENPIERWISEKENPIEKWINEKEKQILDLQKWQERQEKHMSWLETLIVWLAVLLIVNVIWWYWDSFFRYQKVKE